VLYLRLPHHRGDDVRALQGWLNLLGFDAGREDGIFGERTDRAVREFQRNVGLPGDGIVASETLSALARLRPVGPGPGRATVREGEALSRLSASLEGARIALDPGHGGDDPGSAGPSGLMESWAAEEMTRSLFEALAARGSEPFILREPGATATQGDRARLANERGAEILISMHLAADPDPQVRGARCYYYGRGGYVSQAGQRLAEIILEELTARLGAIDRGAHPMSVPLLRETRMPAVHVESCFVTNPDEEARLGQPSYRTDVAQAVVAAVERFFDGDVSRRVAPSAEGGQQQAQA
ncbi:MAG TPA: N-acetylmuramoyl-L-alanine amidase, partial [Actinomycetota bacterium]|nr:N-acetylmuramoyl-L-alanine amidase [Actinomycetota bacterium]